QLASATTISTTAGVAGASMRSWPVSRAASARFLAGTGDDRDDSGGADGAGAGSVGGSAGFGGLLERINESYAVERLVPGAGAAFYAALSDSADPDAMLAAAGPPVSRRASAVYGGGSRRASQIRLPQTTVGSRVASRRTSEVSAAAVGVASTVARPRTRLRTAGPASAALGGLGSLVSLGARSE
ncbi:hypothetical protein HK405_007982, partial [Cladochytrium tenue]